MNRVQRRLVAGLVIAVLAVAMVVLAWMVVHLGSSHPGTTQAALPGSNQDQPTAAVNPVATPGAGPAAQAEAKPAVVAAGATPVKIRAMEILASAPAELRPTAQQTQQASQIAAQTAQQFAGRLADVRTKQQATMTALRQAQAAGNADTVSDLQQNLASLVGAETALRKQTATQVNEQVAKLLTPDQASFVESQPPTAAKIGPAKPIN